MFALVGYTVSPAKPRAPAYLPTRRGKSFPFSRHVIQLLGCRLGAGTTLWIPQLGSILRNRNALIHRDATSFLPCQYKKIRIADQAGISSPGEEQVLSRNYAGDGVFGIGAGAIDIAKLLVGKLPGVSALQHDCCPRNGSSRCIDRFAGDCSC